MKDEPSTIDISTKSPEQGQEGQFANHLSSALSYKNYK